MTRPLKKPADRRSRRLRFEACEERLPLDGEGLETVPLFTTSTGGTISSQVFFASTPAAQTIPQWRFIDTNSAASAFDSPLSFSDQLNAFNFINDESNIFKHSFGVSPDSIEPTSTIEPSSSSEGNDVLFGLLDGRTQLDNSVFRGTSTPTLATRTNTLDARLVSNLKFRIELTGVDHDGDIVAGVTPASGNATFGHDNWLANDAGSLEPFAPPIKLVRTPESSNDLFATSASNQSAVADTGVGEPIAIAALFVETPARTKETVPEPPSPVANPIRLASTATLLPPVSSIARPGFDTTDRVETTTNRIARAWAFEFASFESASATMTPAINPVGQAPTHQPSAEPLQRNAMLPLGEALLGTVERGVEAVLASSTIDPQTAPPQPTTARLMNEDAAFELGPTLLDSECQRCGLAASTLALLAIERVRRQADKREALVAQPRQRSPRRA